MQFTAQIALCKIRPADFRGRLKGTTRHIWQRTTVSLDRCLFAVFEPCKAARAAELYVLYGTFIHWNKQGYLETLVASHQ